MSSSTYGPGIEITGKVTPEYAQILTPPALAFVARLQRAFGARRNELLAARAALQREFDSGKRPDFLPGMRAVRHVVWKCQQYQSEIHDLCMEQHGTLDRK